MGIPLPPPTARENAVRLRAKGLLGSDADVVPRALATRAGAHRGVLVYGYLVVREGDVIGMSPPLGNRLDLGWLGTPEEALADALQRRAEGRAPYDPLAVESDAPEILRGDGRRPSEPRPYWRPSASGTTSSIDLPVGG